MNDREMTEQEEECWCAARRAAAIAYLDRELTVHGQVGQWPAWHEAPYVAVFAVESVVAPGHVGWWVVCGDLPTDYCSGTNVHTPREALEAIAISWRDAIAQTAAGDEEIFDSTLPASLAPLLAIRAKLLLDIAADASNWSD